MIIYKFPEEKEFINFFSTRLGQEFIPNLLEKSEPINKEEAILISNFFWKMIDEAVSLNDTEECPWPEGYEFWAEKILQSTAAFLKKSGYESIFSKASQQ